jgi:hypothetical protein
VIDMPRLAVRCGEVSSQLVELFDIFAVCLGQPRRRALVLCGAPFSRRSVDVRPVTALPCRRYTEKLWPVLSLPTVVVDFHPIGVGFPPCFCLGAYFGGFLSAVLARVCAVSVRVSLVPRQRGGFGAIDALPADDIAPAGVPELARDADIVKQFKTPSMRCAPKLESTLRAV